MTKTQEAYDYLLKLYIKRRDSDRDHAKFVGAAMVYQKFTGMKQRQLSDKLAAETLT